MIAKYIKKPVVIEAVKWTGDNYDEISSFIGKSLLGIYRIDGLLLVTLEGAMEASVGDFIIKGIKGEFYPCKPDIFEQTYELAKEGNQAVRIWNTRMGDACEDPKCACHQYHDGHHDKLLPCPKCGGQARIYKDMSGYYFVECTKCRSRNNKHEFTEYWAALFWNKDVKKSSKVEDEEIPDDEIPDEDRDENFQENC